MYFISQAFIYLALAIIIGGAIGFAIRSCITDTSCDDVREDLVQANARYAELQERQNAVEPRHIVTAARTVVSASRFAEMDSDTLERELLNAAPGKPLKARFGPDDLTSIRGITPKIDAWLGLNGVTRFSQVADLSAAELYWLVENLPENGNSVYRDNWVAQAHSLAGDNG